MPVFALAYLGAMVFAYLVGCIPTSYWAVRLKTGQDIRRLGDGNAGAANAGRMIGRKAGIAVGVVDVGKGVAAVLLVRGLVDSAAVEMIAGFAVVAGHNWPVVLQGRGGRGGAPAGGVLLALLPLAAIPLTGIALVVLYLTRSSTKALACFYIPLPFLSMWALGYSYGLAGYAVALPVMVGLSHYFSLKSAALPGPVGPTGQATF